MVAARRGALRGRTGLLVTTAGVALGVLGLVLLFAPRGASAGTSDTAEVASVAGDFAVEYNTYDLAKIDDYQDRMRGLMTDSLFEEFSTVTKALSEALEEKKQTSGDATVQSVAVEELSESEAVVLVAVDALVRNTDVDEAGAQRHFRWRLALEKQGNDWVVDTFASVVSTEAGTVPKTDAPDENEEKP